MEHFQQGMTIAATPAAVYRGLTTLAGLQGWWTRDCDGSAAVGETIHFRFGQCSKAMRVAKLEPGRAVHWVCTQAHIEAPGVTRQDEWIGTEMVFSMSDAGEGRTRLQFDHHGLVPAFECYGLCSDGWKHFLASLKQYLETGAGHPYENDRRVAA